MVWSRRIRANRELHHRQCHSPDLISGLSGFVVAETLASRGFHSWVLLFTACARAGNHVSCASARSKKCDKKFSPARPKFIFKNKKIIVDALIRFWQIVSRSLWFM